MRVALFAALVAVATLNREMTGLLIILAMIASYPKQVGFWLPSAIIWGALIVGLRVLIPASSPYTIAYVWQGNTTAWRVQGAILYIGLLLPLLVLLYARLHRVAPQVRRMVLVVLLPYMLLFLLFASYQEVRLLMPVLILGVPLYGQHTVHH